MDIKLFLEKYRNLEDCIIRNISFEKFQMKLEIVVEYIWNDEGFVKPFNEKEDIFIMRFDKVQEVIIKNNFNDSMLMHPEELDFGINTISLAKLVNDPKLLDPYKKSNNNFQHFAFLWNSGRRIDIVFIDFSYTQKLRLIE